MKKKITAVALVVALLAVGIIGGTLAYFTDTGKVTNTFTSGNVAIELSEAQVKKDATTGNLVEDTDADRIVDTAANGAVQSYKLFPGMTVCKDPTITVGADSEDAYVAFKCTIKGDLLDLYGADDADPKTYYNLDVNKFLSGGLIAEGATMKWTEDGKMYFEDDNGYYYQIAENGNKGEDSEWVMWTFVKAVQHANDTVTLFNTLTVDKDFNNTQMAKLNGASVVVEAYAVQQYGFSNCYAAMNAAGFIG